MQQENIQIKRCPVSLDFCSASACVSECVCMRVWLRVCVCVCVCECVVSLGPGPVCISVVSSSVERREPTQK